MRHAGDGPIQGTRSAGDATRAGLAEVCSGLRRLDCIAPQQVHQSQGPSPNTTAQPLKNDRKPGKHCCPYLLVRCRRRACMECPQGCPHAPVRHQLKPERQSFPNG
eukprot:8063666-Alexandrium_andersonii.AAC.1